MRLVMVCDLSRAVADSRPDLSFLPTADDITPPSPAGGGWGRAGYLGLPPESGRQHTGDNLSAVPSVDPEVGIGGEDNGVGEYLGHTHEAGVRQAHGNP